MTLLYIFLCYALVGAIFVSMSMNHLIKENKLPLTNITNSQYIMIVLYGSIFWLPLIIYVFVHSQEELKSIIEDEEKLEKYRKERDEKDKK